jgi:nucleoside-diphosphate-sugar epimerase
MSIFACCVFGCLANDATIETFDVCPMKLLLTGATGMVGGAVLQAALADPEVEHVTALVRTRLSISEPKLTVIEHKDFLDYSGLDRVFADHDTCVWCLGISQTRVKNDDEYTRITMDYTLAAAKAMLQANPAMKFLFLSGLGADSSESSRTLFARVKGKTENALLRLPFQTAPNRLFIFRPGAITPGPDGNPRGPWAERMLYPFHPVLRKFFPAYFIKVGDLARIMLRVARHGTSKQILENRDLVAMIERPVPDRKPSKQQRR